MTEHDDAIDIGGATRELRATRRLYTLLWDAVEALDSDKGKP